MTKEITPSHTMPAFKLHDPRDEIGQPLRSLGLHRRSILPRVAQSQIIRVAYNSCTRERNLIDPSDGASEDVNRVGLSLRMHASF